MSTGRGMWWDFNSSKRCDSESTRWFNNCVLPRHGWLALGTSCGMLGSTSRVVSLYSLDDPIVSDALPDLFWAVGVTSIVHHDVQQGSFHDIGASLSHIWGTCAGDLPLTWERLGEHLLMGLRRLHFHSPAAIISTRRARPKFYKCPTSDSCSEELLLVLSASKTTWMGNGKVTSSPCHVRYPGLFLIHA